MNVFLLTDLEGLIGVTDMDYVDRTGEKYQLARRYLTDTINHTVRLCRNHGADRVYVLDGHGGGGNAIAEDLIPEAEQVDIAGWQELIRSGKIDCQIEVGGHARAGSLGGFLDHTMNSKMWFRYTINGIEVGEVGIHAAFCGAYGVPIVFFSGDEVACEQAEELLPGITCAAVKTATERNFATGKPDAERIFDEALVRALNGWKKVKPYRAALPATVEVTFYRTDFCEKALAKCTDAVVRRDARTLSRTLTEIPSYQALKF